MGVEKNFKKIREWNFDPILPEFNEKIFEECQKKIDTIKEKILTFKDKLDSLSTEDFLSILDMYEEIDEHSSRMYMYNDLKFYQNTKNQEALSFKSRIEQYLSKKSNDLLFFNLWFKGLKDEEAQKYIDAAKDHTYYLGRQRFFAKHTLTEPEEKIINIKNLTGTHALVNVFDIFTAALKFDYRGEQIIQSELLTKVHSNDPDERKDAYIALLERYKDHKDVIFEIYKNIVNDWREEKVELRSYDSPINVRNAWNNLSDKAVDALLSVVEKNFGVFQEYFKLKAKSIGVDKLRRYDIYAPVEKEDEEKIPYEKAVEMILESFEDFDPQFVDIAKDLLEDGQVDAIPGEFKRDGAFCYGASPKIKPYILMSYQGEARDVSTLAHELGHAIHDTYCMDQNSFHYHPVLPLAETASIFCEMLLSEKLKKENPDLARHLIFDKIDDLYASIARQAGFVLFERVGHDMIRNGCTCDELSDKYMELIKKQFGDAMEISDEFAFEWTYIPHIFHTPFYCYAYTFGNLMVLAIYHEYCKRGDEMKEKIIDVLKMGSSASPADITKHLGVDIETEEFWQSGIDLIKEMIKEVS